VSQKMFILHRKYDFIFSAMSQRTKKFTSGLRIAGLPRSKLLKQYLIIRLIRNRIKRSKLLELNQFHSLDKISAVKSS